MEAKVVVTTELQLKAIIADAVSAAFRYYQPVTTVKVDESPFAGFKWLCDTCSNIPPSTLRQWDSEGKIPGSSKIGKRRVYEKVIIINWLRSQVQQPVDSSVLDRAVETQFDHQLSKKEIRA